MRKLHDAHIHLNQHAVTLLSNDLATSSEIMHADVYVASVRDIGFINGATLAQVTEQVMALGYRPCTLELAIHLRLIYTIQPAAIVDNDLSGAPKGSLTVLSQPRRADDEYPKGLYLRNIDDQLWLRGYRCSNEHVWSPGDVFLFSS